MQASFKRQEVQNLEHYQTLLRSQSDKTVVERKVEAMFSITTTIFFLEDHD